MEAKLCHSADAKACYRQAINMRPEYFAAYNNLGILLKDEKQFDEAETWFRQAIRINREYAEAYSNLGTVLQEKGQFDEAEACFRQAIALSGKNPTTYNNLGAVLRKKKQFDEAEAYFRQAIALQPDFPEAYVNLGIVLTETSRFREAEHYLQRAAAWRPDFSNAAYALATLYLLNGNFDKGWKKYESRFAVFKNYEPAIRRWRGEDLKGRTILLFYEQGLGDTLQFMRYVPQVAQLAKKTVVWVQKPLLRLIAGGEHHYTVYAGDRIEPQAYDFACPLLSLPLVFGTTEKNIPPVGRYIYLNRDISRKWHKILTQFGGGKIFRVGVVWAGNPGNQNDGNRSVPFSVFAELFAGLHVSWISLQVGERAQDLKGTSYKIADFSPELTDFAETAGMIENLDLVITADTAVAHLSATMGKKTWLLLSYIHDWRWQMQRTDSPWYPAIKIFCQQRIDDWHEVIKRVKKALAAVT